MNNNMTPVIFRKFKDNDIIALLPTIPGDMNPNTCESYMHIGQHGSADLGIIYDTKLAKQTEYDDLLQELESIGYEDLKVYSKVLQWMDDTRHKELKELM